MGKTTLTNNSGSNVQVKEVNSIIVGDVRVLKPGDTVTIKVVRTAASQEFSLIVLPENKKLRSLTSDNIQEVHAIEIFQDETGEYGWKELWGGAEKKPWFDSFLGLFSRKAGAKADAKAHANAESSKSSTATQ